MPAPRPGSRRNNPAAAASFKALACLACGGLVACATTTGITRGPFAPEDQGIEPRLLDGDLVKFLVLMGSARQSG